LFRKIRFRGRKIKIVFGILAMATSVLACSQGYVSNYDLTATALFPVSSVASATVQSTVDPNTVSDPTASLATSGATVAGPDQTGMSSPTETPDPAYPTPQGTSLEGPLNTQVPTRVIPTPTVGTPLPPILYHTQAGDTLPAIAVRYGVSVDEVSSASGDILPASGLINPGELLIIPDRLGDTGPGDLILPDSEVVYSPSALDLDIDEFVKQAGGYLSTYREYLSGGWQTGAQVIYKVAIENSINPRFLLALLEYQSGWVYGQPSNLAKTNYPMGWIQADKKGLFAQLSLAVQKIMIGYYGWRDGTLTQIDFADGTSVRLAPQLNAGTVAVQYLFSSLYEPILWNGVLGGSDSFGNLYTSMLGDPWVRAQSVEPLLPVNLTQPDLILPFLPGHTWSFSGGPHPAWGPDGARAALDFAPSSTEPGCVTSEEWVTAVADGTVVREGTGIVVLDLDGDGSEQTGWSILYLHVATRDKVPLGAQVHQGDPIGHPSCEGGTATGTHVHIARKYNGEWVLAGGPLPFDLSGWQAVAGPNNYQGELIKDGQVVTACSCGSFETRITRPASEP
jgi:LasA protease